MIAGRMDYCSDVHDYTEERLLQQYQIEDKKEK
jgi:hypothetical protein